MPVIRNPALPNYLISCSSKHKRRSPVTFSSSGRTSEAKSRSHTHPTVTNRCSSAADADRRRSKFRILHGQNHFPFEIDYSKEPHPLTKELSMAWREPIQMVDVEILLPELLEGYEDSNLKYHRLVDAALNDLLRHASLAQLFVIGANLRSSFKRLFSSRNTETILSGLRALQQITRVIQRAACFKPQAFRSILVPLNMYYLQYRNSVDVDAPYETRKSMLHCIDKTLSHVESFTFDLNRRWKFVRIVDGSYKGYSSKLMPEKSAITNLKKMNNKQRRDISNCLTFRQHKTLERSWRKLNRFNITPQCRDILNLMPWVVPKNSNFYIKKDDVRVIDMNLM